MHETSPIKLRWSEAMAHGPSLQNQHLKVVSQLKIPQGRPLREKKNATQETTPTRKQTRPEGKNIEENQAEKHANSRAT